MTQSLERAGDHAKNRTADAGGKGLPEVAPPRRSNPLQFFGEVRREMSKVTWPTWKDTKRATIVVIVTTLVLAGLLGLLDLAWGALTRLFYS